MTVITKTANPMTSNPDVASARQLSPQVIRFLQDSHVVDEETWQLIIERASATDGEISVDSLFHEFNQHLASWAEDDRLESPLTPYHRQMVERLAKGWSIPAPGVRVGQYLLLDILGQGGQGRVYRAVRFPHKRPSDARKFRVVKLGRRGDRRLREREAAILRLLHDFECPHVPRLVTDGEIGRRPFLITTYREGLDLRRHIKQHGPLSVQQAIDCTRMISRTLQHAHEAGVIHRDLKPSNLIVAPGKRMSISIIDWGLGTLDHVGPSDPDPFEEAPQLSMSSTRVGTFAWMSPEHFQCSRSIVTASDTYALGCILFYMLTGEAPFSGSAPELTYQHTHAERPSVSARRQQINPDWAPVPEQLEFLIREMMAVSIDQRPSLMTCDAVLTAASKTPRIAPTGGPATKVSALNSAEDSSLADASETSSMSVQPTAIEVQTPSKVVAESSVVEPHSHSTSHSVAESHDRYSAIPTRSEPRFVLADALINLQPGHRRLPRCTWPGPTQSPGEFYHQLHRERELFDSDEQLARSEDLQRLAYEKESVGNLEGAIEQWQAAWRMTPWNSVLRRQYLKALRQQVPAPAKVDAAFPKASRELRMGRVSDALQATEAKIAQQPWSIGPLWEEAIALDLLGYWESCQTTIWFMLTAHPGQTREMSPLLGIAARLSAMVGNAQQARSSLKAIEMLDADFARSPEFRDLAMKVDAQLTAVGLVRRQAEPVYHNIGV